MSMEAALDEERLAVLELMEGMNKPAPQKRQRGSSGSLGTAPPLLRGSSPTTSPRSPVRSMLDIADDSIPRHASIAGTSSSGISQPVRSMLDIGPSPLQKSQSNDKTRSANTSPTESAATAPLSHHRSLSDAVNQPPNFGPRGLGRHNGDITDDYQFSGYLQSNPGGPVAPKRNTLAGKKPAGNAMADAMGGNLGPNPKNRGRSLGALPGINVPKSRSPHNRLSVRSASPATANLNMLVMDSGLMVDKDSAYRRLSDANLALGGGSLSSLAHRKKSDSDSRGRLTKDYSYNEEGVMESSDDDSDTSDGPRGRKHRSSNDEKVDTPLGFGRADNGPRTPKSLMAAAEEERQTLIDEQKKKAYKVRSLLEPEIKVTGPEGQKLKMPNKTGVHPSNAFDLGGASGINTPHDSDTEQEISDIRRAQRLAILLTPIASKPETQRSVRTMFRGDFAKMQRDAREEGRRNRKYLVATDLSEEAAHALEWTVGTVLRDGDTLLAIYCVDEDSVINSEGPTPSLERQAEAIAGSAISLPPSTLSNLRHSIAAGSGHAHIPSPLGVGTPRGIGTPRSANSPSPLTRNISHAEQERYRAVEDITERVSKLLRKTKLQVRVVVEVIHCKSPKHLICEVIDYFEPTMVVLGSRGRSALKGYVYEFSSSPVFHLFARRSSWKKSGARKASKLLIPRTAPEPVSQCTQHHIKHTGRLAGLAGDRLLIKGQKLTPCAVSY